MRKLFILARGLKNIEWGGLAWCHGEETRAAPEGTALPVQTRPDRNACATGKIPQRWGPCVSDLFWNKRFSIIFRVFRGLFDEKHNSGMKKPERVTFGKNPRIMFFRGFYNTEHKMAFSRCWHFGCRFYWLKILRFGSVVQASFHGSHSAGFSGTQILIFTLF